MWVQIRNTGSNPGLLRLWRWQSDALTTRLDLMFKLLSHENLCDTYCYGNLSLIGSEFSFKKYNGRLLVSLVHGIGDSPYR
jgi:hypothetical protein